MNDVCEHCGLHIGHDRLCPFFKDIASDYTEEAEEEEARRDPRGPLPEGDQSG